MVLNQKNSKFETVTQEPNYTPLNDDKDTKPSKQLIKCVPQDCAKSFKRRPWSPKEDIIFRYTDNSQNLVFYRNPFLNTVVVMDEMMAHERKDCDSNCIHDQLGNL